MNKTMEEKEMEIFTDIMRKCGVNTYKHTWSELEDMATAMEVYHQAQLKLLSLHNVSKSKAKCDHNWQECTHEAVWMFSKCTKCGKIK